jgi:2-methylcitrate dehydratase PrpD
MESVISPGDTIARTLSGFAQALRLDRVPPAVSERARHLMLDAIGCALAARREPFALKFRRRRRHWQRRTARKADAA